MFRIVRRSKEEHLLREVLAERERLVMLLVEMVEYHRAQLGAATTTVSRAATGETPVPTTPFPDSTSFSITASDMSDDEEELTAMLQANVITRAEYDEAMSRLQTRTADSIIE